MKPELNCNVKVESLEAAPNVRAQDDRNLRGASNGARDCDGTFNDSAP